MQLLKLLELFEEQRQVSDARRFSFEECLYLGKTDIEVRIFILIVCSIDNINVLVLQMMRIPVVLVATMMTVVVRMATMTILATTISMRL